MTKSITPSGSSASNRLILGGAAFAASATAALAIPTYSGPLALSIDGTVTTSRGYAQLFNIFSGDHTEISPDTTEKPSDATYTKPGTLLIITNSQLDTDSSGGAFTPGLLGTSSDSNVGGPSYGTAFPVLTPGGLIAGTGLSTTISMASFPSDAGHSTAITASLGQSYTVTDDPSTYNTWLAGASAPFFAPFAMSYSENSSTMTTITLGYLELFYDAPSVSLTLLSYGYETFDAADAETASIVTPDSFTEFTPPADFVMGSIPEPSSYALGAALLAGSVALLRRRRAPAAA